MCQNWIKLELTLCNEYGAQRGFKSGSTFAKALWLSPPVSFVCVYQKLSVCLCSNRIFLNDMAECLTKNNMSVHVWYTIFSWKQRVRDKGKTIKKTLNLSKSVVTLLDWFHLLWLKVRNFRKTELPQNLETFGTLCIKCLLPSVKSSSCSWRLFGWEDFAMERAQLNKTFHFETDLFEPGKPLNLQQLLLKLLGNGPRVF